MIALSPFRVNSRVKNYCGICSATGYPTIQLVLTRFDVCSDRFWNTGSNTKEWVVLELQSTALITQIRINNKSVTEWELTASLSLSALKLASPLPAAKGDSRGGSPHEVFSIRPRCEALTKRDISFKTSQIPCRYLKVWHGVSYWTSLL